MIQSAVNQLLSIGAAARRTSEMTAAREASRQMAAAREERAVAREARAAAREEDRIASRASREKQARDHAIQRAQDKIRAKYTQKMDYKNFTESLGAPNAPDVLKKIAYEKYLELPKISIGGIPVDPMKLSPEAIHALQKRGNK